MSRSSPKVIGPAERWLARKRKEREPVTLTFSQKALGVLSAMIRNPEMLVARCPGVQQWRAKGDAARRQVIRIQRLIEQSIQLDTGVKDAQGNRIFEFPESWTGDLPTPYVDLLKEIARHYESAAEFVIFSDGYCQLVDALEGKRPEDSLDELIGYKDPEAKP
jgi:hypothetical protein